MCFCFSFLDFKVFNFFFLEIDSLLPDHKVWHSVEKFHAQLVVDLDKSCVDIKNVVIYAVFVEFIVFVVVK